MELGEKNKDEEYDDTFKNPKDAVKTDDYDDTFKK